MSKNRPTTPGTRDSAGARGAAIPLWIRVLATLVLVWHLLAVVMAALSIPGSTPVADYIAQQTFMQRYLDAMHLNQGHAFFAPNPPVMVTIQYEILDERGKQIERGEFPNSKEERPRLFYHRFFMLAEQSGPDAPVNLDAREKQLNEKYLAGFARNLLRHSEGASIRAQRVIQELVSPEEFLAGKPLNKGQYHILAEVTQTRRDLEAEKTLSTSRLDAGGWNSGGRQ